MRDRKCGRSSSRRNGRAEGAGAAARSARFARDNAIAIARVVSLYFAHGEPGSRARLSSTLDFRYIAIEGPAGVGKSLLADRLGSRLDATVVLDETENPFLADFYADRPGAGFHAQPLSPLARHRT